MDHWQPLDAIRAKLDRAEDHIRWLDREVAAWVTKEQPYTACHNYEARKQKWVCTSTLLIDKEPPPKFGVIFGEAIHDMRSALDQLVHGLVKAEGGQPSDNSAFPVYLSAKRWREKVDRRKWFIWRQKGSGPLKGLSRNGPAFQLINEYQPYQPGKRGKDDPLYALDDLWNRDKHRFLNPFAVRSNMTSQAIVDCFAWTPALTPAWSHSPVSRGDVLYEGTKLLTIGWPRSDSFPPKVYSCKPLSLAPALGEGKGDGSLLDTLAYVRKLLSEAERLL